MERILPQLAPLDPRWQPGTFRCGAPVQLPSKPMTEYVVRTVEDALRVRALLKLEGARFGYSCAEVIFARGSEYLAPLLSMEILQ